MGDFIKTAARAVKNFFVNTFRNHGTEEYCEVLTRGIREEKSGKNNKYPWLYLRVFCACFILFAVYVFILRMLGNDVYLPTVILFGGVMFCLPFIVFLYELYPGRDFSLMSLACVLILGGTLACVITQVMYFVTPEASGWLASVRAGGIEELCKAVVAILIIVIIKVRSPLLGFLVGAAVGAGYSIVEDMGYIFYYADGLFSNDIPAIISVCFGRGATAFCTHILWTGLVGYSYVRHDKHVTQAAFYLTVAYVFIVHTLWDNPLSGVWYGLIIAVCVFATVLPSILAFIHGSREERGYDEQTEMQIPFGVTKVRNGNFFRHGANLTFAGYLMILAVCALAYCSLPVGTAYNSITFYDTAEFVSYAQNGHELTADWTREYDQSLKNSEEHYVDGVLTQVVQTQTTGGYNYFYYYTVDGGEYNLTSIMVDVNDGGATRRYTCVNIYYQGKQYVSFFVVNSAVTGYAVDGDGNITAILYDDDAVVNAYPDEYSVVGYVALGFTVAEVAIYAAFAIKGYRVDKVNKLTE